VRVGVLVDRIQVIRTLRKAVRTGAGPHPTTRLLPLSSWGEVIEGVRGESFDLVILQPSIGVGPWSPAPKFTELERLVSLFPGSRAILYFCRPKPTPSDLRDLARMGFPYWLIQGIDDDTRTIQRAVARAEARRILTLRSDAQGTQMEEEPLALLLHSTTGWPPVRLVEDLANQQYMSRRTFQRRLKGLNLPSPGRLLSCGRFLEVCALWRSMGIRDRFRIGLILGFGDPSSIGHLSRTLTGRPLGHFLRPDSDADPFDWFWNHVIGQDARSG